MSATRSLARDCGLVFWRSAFAKTVEEDVECSQAVNWPTAGSSPRLPGKSCRKRYAIDSARLPLYAGNAFNVSVDAHLEPSVEGLGQSCIAAHKQSAFVNLSSQVASSKVNPRHDRNFAFDVKVHVKPGVRSAQLYWFSRFRN